MTLRREDGRIVCDSVIVADGTFRRLRGLLGRKALRPDEGIVLRPAWSIHTAFMRFSIDVVFVDRQGYAVKVVRNMQPWRIALATSGRVVIEMAAGSLRWGQVLLGDRLYLAPASAIAREGNAA